MALEGCWAVEAFWLLVGSKWMIIPVKDMDIWIGLVFSKADPS
jgi:hypothetical protein